jgi:hypothetical protein
LAIGRTWAPKNRSLAEYDNMTARIKALRTPEERFAKLPGYAFRPHYLDNLKGYEG